MRRSAFQTHARAGRETFRLLHRRAVIDLGSKSDIAHIKELSVKKTLLAIAVGSTLLATSVASAAPTVYGRFNLALDSQKDEIDLDFGTEDRTIKLRDNNNSSRLGVKGKEELGMGDLSVIYQLEYGIDPDGSESNVFSKRNIYVGLQGGFGKLTAGYYDTLVKNVGGEVDQFGDTVGDITRLMRGETRTGNQITYVAPKFGNVVLSASVQLGEGRTASDNVNDVEDGIADTFYLSAEYEGDAIYAAIAYADNEPGSMRFDGSSSAKDILRVVGKYSWSAFEIGGLYQTAEGIDQTGGLNGSDFQEDSWLISGAWKTGDWKLKAQLGETEGDFTGVTRMMVGIGADYKLSKAATTQVYYVSYEDQDRVVNGITDPTTDTFGVAFIYKF
jgi:predicted porin